LPHDVLIALAGFSPARHPHPRRHRRCVSPCGQWWPGRQAARPESEDHGRKPAHPGRRPDQIDKAHQRQPVHSPDHSDQRRQYVDNDERHEDKDPERVAIRLSSASPHSLLFRREPHADECTTSLPPGSAHRQLFARLGLTPLLRAAARHRPASAAPPGPRAQGTGKVRVPDSKGHAVPSICHIRSMSGVNVMTPGAGVTDGRLPEAVDPELAGPSRRGYWR
jgi:hypothetical protein